MEEKLTYEQMLEEDSIYVHVKVNGTEVLFGSRPGMDVLKDSLPPRTIKIIRAILEDAIEELDRDS